MEVERITHAAVKSKKRKLILFGKSHAECFHKGYYSGIEMSSKADDQGFMTSRGRFVIRPRAAALAWKSKQTNKKLKVLFSEDLWSEHSGGKYNYDHIKGYVLK